jgi:ATP-dependent helicase/nuclease subunit A
MTVIPVFENAALLSEHAAEPDRMSAEEYKQIIKERFDYRYPSIYLEKIPAKLSVSELYPSILDRDMGEYTSAELKPAEEIRMLRDRPEFMKKTPDKASNAERGTATHVFMQFCNFSRTERYGVKNELECLVEENFMPRSAADLVNINQAETFFGGKLYTEIKNSRKIWREIRFNIKLPASDFSSDANIKKMIAGENILVQGVIDCFFYDKNDRLVIVDYKTDYISSELRADRDKAKSILAERHRLQLSYYKAAIERITRKPVDAVYIYSFGLDDTIELYF